MELAFLPSGRLAVSEGTPAESPRPQKALMAAFEAGSAPGLLALVNSQGNGDWSPDFRYWRDFAAAYLTKLCQTPEEVPGRLADVPAPTPAEWSTWALSVPPMRGAEYITPQVLETIWRDLNDWVRGEVSRLGSLPEFLESKAPRWHQVGRVCFHLAENRRDPAHPFAFLATYAPQLGKSGKVQYQPLSQALTEYAGAKNKHGLIRLLSPVDRAAKQSRLVKELVESGAIYHPQAWTPPEAYRFLKEVPIFEDSGVFGSPARLVEETPASPRGSFDRRESPQHVGL
jgi:hypothetical protein